MADEVLEPCPNPWCVAMSLPLPAKTLVGEWYVMCGCGVQSHRAKTEGEAIVVWNTRPRATADASDVERARAVAKKHIPLLWDGAPTDWWQAVNAGHMDDHEYVQIALSSLQASRADAGLREAAERARIYQIEGENGVHFHIDGTSYQLPEHLEGPMLSFFNPLQEAIDAALSNTTQQALDVKLSDEAQELIERLSCISTDELEAISKLKFGTTHQADNGSDVNIPGTWRCAKCKVIVIRSNLNANDGSITANNEPEKCPNECGPLWPVTWKEQAQELMKQVEKDDALDLDSEFGAFVEANGYGQDSHAFAIADKAWRAAERFCDAKPIPETALRDAAIAYVEMHHNGRTPDQAESMEAFDALEAALAFKAIDPTTPPIPDEQIAENANCSGALIAEAVEAIERLFAAMHEEAVMLSCRAKDGGPSETGKIRSLRVNMENHAKTLFQLSSKADAALAKLKAALPAQEEGE